MFQPAPNANRITITLPIVCLCLSTLALFGCRPTPSVARIALIAPFEGRQREIGYQALYAARLALSDAGNIHTDLLALDDGGTPTTAADRLRGVYTDPSIRAVIILGPAATNALDAAPPPARLAVWQVGQWADDLAAFTRDPAPPTCDDACAIPVFTALATDPAAVVITSQAPPVPPAFARRYLAADPFAPDPLPIAYQTYQAIASVLADAPVTGESVLYRDQYNYQWDGETLVHID